MFDMEEWKQIIKALEVYGESIVTIMSTIEINQTDDPEYEKITQEMINLTTLLSKISIKIGKQYPNHATDESYLYN